MSSKKVCKVCGNQVNWPAVKREFASLLQKIDRKGPTSLSEAESLVYNEYICSMACYNLMR